MKITIEEMIPDITDLKNRKRIFLDNVLEEDSIKRMKESTGARIGIGSCGPRLKTEVQLIMRADHGAARDTVLTDVSSEFIKDMNLYEVQTLCKDKEEYLRRPDLGRRFSEQTLQKIRKLCISGPQIQIFVADGLSSQAIEANAGEMLPVMMDGFRQRGIQVGTPFFVKYGRVATEDYISEALNSELTCVLIGERPGLLTAKSMSAYIVYRGIPGSSESRRTVISNIHENGFPPAEAGAYAVEIMARMLEVKCSGVEFRRDY